VGERRRVVSPCTVSDLDDPQSLGCRRDAAPYAIPSAPQSATRRWLASDSMRPASAPEQASGSHHPPSSRALAALARSIPPSHIRRWHPSHSVPVIPCGSHRRRSENRTSKVNRCAPSAENPSDHSDGSAPVRPHWHDDIAPTRRHRPKSMARLVATIITARSVSGAFGSPSGAWLTHLSRSLPRTAQVPKHDQIKQP
jgi:hypothetical protein